VPARFWADGEVPILVSVRRKSSRALPSESNPVKVGLKVDINELVGGQKWRGLTKVSLENGADSGVVEEGLAWNLHRLAAGPDGYLPALASWVQLRVNGQLIGVYVNVEQRDKQMLRNRGLWVDDETWVYEQDDVGAPVLEEGEGTSPTFSALCYSPFNLTGGKRGGGACPTPNDATLALQLPQLINMNGMLTIGAVDAYLDNHDSLIGKGKNFSFADFSDPAATGKDTRRLYFPWDLDTVFRTATGGIYGTVNKSKASTSPYQEVILRHPTFRAQYNQIMLDLVNGPLSVANVHSFLNQTEVALSAALAADPHPTGDGQSFDRLRQWVAARDANVRAQLAANGPPAPRR
jgi:CotH kinase protein